MEVARKRLRVETMLDASDDSVDGDTYDPSDVSNLSNNGIENVYQKDLMDVDKYEKNHSNKKPYKVDPSLIRQLDAIGDHSAREFEKKRNPNLPQLPSWALVSYYDDNETINHSNDNHDSYDQGQVVGGGIKGTGGMGLSLGLGSLPPSLQEIALLEDLLFIMTGIDGKYIHVTRPSNSTFRGHGTSQPSASFSMSPSIDVTYHKLVDQMLPLSHHYVNVQRYVASKDQFESGLVSHALCAAINTILKDYLILVAQLESQLRDNKLTLQKLWFYIQNEMKKMALLDHITSLATRSECYGGALLNLLYTTSSQFACAHMGTEKWMFLLLQHAAVPYLDMLGKWIFKGQIDDPYGEFMVESHTEQQKENLNDDVNDANQIYWEQKYTLRKEQVPVFLEKIADKIVTTGKYLNVMAECGREVKFQDNDTVLIYTNNHSEYIDKIEKAYEMASRKLLDLLCNELDLLNRLRSIKRYFLLDQGDFFTHFMDISLEELQKPTSDISKGKLKSLLELSLRTSSVADIDVYKDDLGIEFHPYTLLDMLLRIIHVAHGSIFVNPIGPPGTNNDNTKGLELFTFSYHVRWPLSLVVSRKVLIKYQLIFRQLSFCKNVELQLSNEWILSMVIEPNWHKFEAAFRKVRTVDEVLKIHTDFVDSCLHECMLTDPRLVRILMKLMAICEAFASVIKRLMDSIMLNTQDRQSGKDIDRDKQRATKTKPRQPDKTIAQPIFDAPLLATIKDADEHFKYHLRLLLEALKAFSTTGESNHCIHRTLAWLIQCFI